MTPAKKKPDPEITEEPSPDESVVEWTGTPSDDVPGMVEKMYPDITGDEPVDVVLYVCETCEPQWDTFYRHLAEAHVEAGLHNRIGEPYQTVVPGQEEQQG